MILILLTLQDIPDVPTDPDRFLGWAVGVLIVVVLALVRYIVAEQKECRKREREVLEKVIEGQERSNRMIASLNDRLDFVRQLNLAMERQKGRPE